MSKEKVTSKTMGHGRASVERGECRGKSQQQEAMAAVMARILASGHTGSAATTAPAGRRKIRAEGLGSVKPKTQRKRRKLKIIDVQFLLTSRHNVW